MSGGSSVGWVGAKDDRFRDRFQKALLNVPSRDLAAGWQLAVDTGRPVAPLLWDMMQAETSNVGRRLVVLAAAVLAGGPAEDERLFAWLDRQKPMLPERALAAMLLALGPRRTRPMPEFWGRISGPARTPEQILAIAVRLAAARFPGTEANLPQSLDDDAGVLAATAYAGGKVPTANASRLWDPRTSERHAELFWRGAMLHGARTLADGGTMPDGLLERARELSALPGEHNGSARAAAAVLRARARDFRAEGSRPDWRLLQIAAADVTSARTLSGWLQPAPQPLDEEPRRLAVAYVLSREPAEVVQDRPAWSSDPRVARHVAVALAWRLLGESPQQPVEVEVPGLPEWGFVKWASGAAIDAGLPIDDPQLRMAAEVASAGRMGRPALRTALEEALWRWGSHPGLSAFEQERLLVRDLLLIGSHPGGSKYMAHVQPEQRYRPTGLGPDDTFFMVAVTLFDFLERPRGPVPPEHRLR